LLWQQQIGPKQTLLSQEAIRNRRILAQGLGDRNALLEVDFEITVSIDTRKFGIRAKIEPAIGSLSKR
jgi:hypothetical protein